LPGIERRVPQPTSERLPPWRASRIGLQTRLKRHGVMEALDPEPLLRFLHEQRVEHILIGGVAVAAHGYRRPSKDLDIVPAPNVQNLERLAHALLALHARPAELGDFEPDEFPADATDLDDLALGGNFRLETDLGSLDVMQWISGVEADDLYRELDHEALTFQLDDVPVRYCSLRHLRAMKTAAGRPRDLDDLEHLPAA
jgi:hypothetical protein